MPKRLTVTVSSALNAAIQQEADERGVSFAFVVSEKLAAHYKLHAQDHTWGGIREVKTDEKDS